MFNVRSVGQRKSDNKTLKSALAGGRQALGEAKAHSLTKPSLARLRNVLRRR